MEYSEKVADGELKGEMPKAQQHAFLTQAIEEEEGLNVDDWQALVKTDDDAYQETALQVRRRELRLVGEKLHDGRKAHAERMKLLEQRRAALDQKRKQFDLHRASFERYILEAQKQRTRNERAIGEISQEIATMRSEVGELSQEMRDARRLRRRMSRRLRRWSRYHRFMERLVQQQSKFATPDDVIDYAKKITDSIVNLINEERQLSALTKEIASKSPQRSASTQEKRDALHSEISKLKTQILDVAQSHKELNKALAIAEKDKRADEQRFANLVSAATSVNGLVARSYPPNTRTLRSVRATDLRSSQKDEVRTAFFDVSDNVVCRVHELEKLKLLYRTEAALLNANGQKRRGAARQIKPKTKMEAKPIEQRRGSRVLPRQGIFAQANYTPRSSKATDRTELRPLNAVGNLGLVYCTGGDDDATTATADTRRISVTSERELSAAMDVLTGDASQSLSQDASSTKTGSTGATRSTSLQLPSR
ncbi:MAG: hypothetical protein MHM6MM_000950 [Cercozoa sp. M6MM]